MNWLQKTQQINNTKFDFDTTEPNTQLNNQFLFHATFAWNLDAILANGLSPFMEKNWLESGDAVSLSKNLQEAFKWGQYAANQLEEQGLDVSYFDAHNPYTIVVLSINTASLDSNKLQTDPLSSNDFAYYDTIDPAAIQLTKKFKLDGTESF